MGDSNNKLIFKMNINNNLIDLLKDISICKKEILTVEEAARLLGFKIDYIYRLTSDRKIPHCKPTNGKLMFVASDLIQWVKDHKVLLQEDISDMADNYLN